MNVIMSDLIITPAHTANPNARKYRLNRPARAIRLNPGNQAGGHPPGPALSRSTGVRSVFSAGHFMTVNVVAGRARTGLG